MIGSSVNEEPSSYARLDVLLTFLARQWFALLFSLEGFSNTRYTSPRFPLSTLSREFFLSEKLFQQALKGLFGFERPLGPWIGGGAKCPKFNIVGSEELNNLQLAQIIAEAQDKELKYELVDFHSARPGHDLRYALDGDKMKSIGWTPAKSVRERIADVTKWTLANKRWIRL